MTAAHMNDLIGKEFPWLAASHVVTAVEDDRLTLQADTRFLEAGPPGGTISGPDQMRLADLAGYLLIKHRVGHESSIRLRTMSMSFLQAPVPGALTAQVVLLRQSKRNTEVRADVVDATAGTVCAGSLLFSVR
ncbi:hypothetical protein BLA24_13995 [Streptomyces cinnamoneus]|uniref:Thioesterase domain-containing protein n=1 Tax=Streptomyces cinnamoneus TaxID=53446 RepID=A0A2G1XJX3_STRCJ|nr:hotdog domain-containing protein [Streptomyces cinnamoneus]PHQ51439.1 hypothetical protein BLA24_13995 [Streptomyces cinnamoneus]PPT11780.1 hypothetical protein CYQ11_01690 [Streptomyces cinnamoneus]